MCVNDLANLIDSCCFSYRVANCNDIDIVVDALDLWDFVCSERIVVSALGIDFTDACAAFRDEVLKLLQCHVKAIFVINGMRPRLHKHIETLASTNFINERLHDPRSVAVPVLEYNLAGSIRLMRRNAVVEILSNLRVNYAMCMYSAFNACAGISCLLGCPILAQNSEYFLLSKPKCVPESLSVSMTHEPLFAPLNGVVFSQSCELDPAYSGLTLHIHDPTSSPIASIEPNCRALIPLLVDEQIVKVSPWREEVKPLEDESFSITKLKQAFNWMSQTGPVHILQSILSTTKEDQCEMARAILERCNKYVPDIHEGFKILSFIGIETPVAELTSTPIAKDENAWESPFAFFEVALDGLNGNYSYNIPLDFMKNWPSQLCTLTRRGKIDPDIFTALYNREGLFLSSPSDYFAYFPAPFSSSLVLRYLQYCLVIGAERPLSYQEVPASTRIVREICYIGSFRFRCFEIPLAKMSPKQTDSPWAFINRFFNFQDGTELSDGTRAILFCLVLWHLQKKGDLDRENSDIINCPIILATLVCALASIECLDTASPSDLCKHYASVTATGQTELLKYCSDDGLREIEFQKRSMHNLHEILTTYGHFLSLHSLLTGLLDKDPMLDLTANKYHTLTPQHVVFPSLKLIVLVAHNLSYIAPHCRVNVASRFWLTKLASPTTGDPVSVERLKKVVFAFQSSMASLGAITLSWDAPHVKETDPPLALIAIGDRLKRVQPTPITTAKSVSSTEPPKVPAGLVLMESNLANAPAATPENPQMHRVCTYPAMEQRPLTSAQPRDCDDTASISGSSAYAASYAGMDMIPRPAPAANALMRRQKSGRASAYASRLQQRFGDKSNAK